MHPFRENFQPSPERFSEPQKTAISGFGAHDFVRHGVKRHAIPARFLQHRRNLGP